MLCQTAVLMCFVLFIIGDTTGDNDLCGHFQNKCGLCVQVMPLCIKQLPMFDSSKCLSLTMYNIRDSITKADKLKEIS